MRVTVVYRGSHAKTYAFSRTAVTTNVDAFKDLKGLQSVRLNDGLEKLEIGCFSGTGIRQLVIPSSVRNIEFKVFESCKCLRRITFAGAGLETIAHEAFAESGLEAFVAPATLRRIGDHAFVLCKRLKHVDLGACAAQSWGEYDFLTGDIFKDSGLESIVLPRTLKIIGEGKFAGCKSLKSVTFG